MSPPHTPTPARAAEPGGVPSRDVRRRNLILRVASAAVLAPLALGSAYLGGWLFCAVCAATAAGILWEWMRLVESKTEPGLLLPGLCGLAFAWLLTGLGRPAWAVAAIAAAALAVVMAKRAPEPRSGTTWWAAGGVLYAGAAYLGPALLRRDPALGLTALLFLAATVWATDIFAFAVGRAIGGPLLWPRISPNKTWAGAAGGLAGGLAAGSLVAYASGIERAAVIGIIALVLSVLTQAGDLFESAIKRRFGAKDTSHLIPGHGGLMDRLDGFLVAALAALLIGVARHGIDAPAQGLLLW